MELRKMNSYNRYSISLTLTAQLIKNKIATCKNNILPATTNSKLSAKSQTIIIQNKILINSKNKQANKYTQ
jgi:hypothetical protein